jgi:serine/threonine protein kinase
MKEMGKKQVKQNQSEWMCVNEMKVLTKMRSPFVLNLKYSFHDENSLYLVFDMCSGGDLKFHLNSIKDRCFPTDRARFYAASVLLGLAHLHSFDIVYRDLKPDNILLNAQGYVKISDLGLTIKLRKNKTLKHLAGTAGYWAPEIVQKSGTHKASDWWSFAVFLYEMLGGRRPKCVCTPKTLEWSPFGQTPAMEDIALMPDSILKIHVEYPPEKYNPEVKDLLEKLFNPDPKTRLGAESCVEIQEHRFFASIDWAKLEALELTPPFIPDPHTVNANSIAEVGEFNQGKWKKIKLTPEDEKHYEDAANKMSFTYISEENIQMELVEALIKEEKNPPKPDNVANDPKNCCAIL